MKTVMRERERDGGTDEKSEIKMEGVKAAAAAACG